MSTLIDAALVYRWHKPEFVGLLKILLLQLERPLSKGELDALEPLKIHERADGSYSLDMRGVFFSDFVFKDMRPGLGDFFSHVLADGSQFVRCTFEGISIQNCSFLGARFDQSIFVGGNILSCDCFQSSFRDVSFNGTSCIGTDFSSSDFCGAKASGGSEFSSCYFIGSVFNENDGIFKQATQERHAIDSENPKYLKFRGKLREFL